MAKVEPKNCSSALTSLVGNKTDCDPRAEGLHVAVMRHSDLGISVRTTVMGRGVFATKKFRKNQVIGRMHGTVIPGDDYDPSYVVDLGTFGVLDPHPPFRFMNHCCSPNAALIEYEDENPKQTPTMWVETLRTIQVGEQICIDYSWPADAAIPCLCGAVNCRGWVVSEEDAKKLRRAADAAAKKALAAESKTQRTPKSKSSKQSKKSAAKQTAAKQTAPKKTSKKSAAKQTAPKKTSKKSAAKQTAPKKTSKKSAAHKQSGKTRSSRSS